MCSCVFMMNDDENGRTYSMKKRQERSEGIRSESEDNEARLRQEGSQANQTMD
jgi:hypothetical protein